MTNNELTLDQLTTIAGGGILKKLKTILKGGGSSGPFNPTPTDKDPGGSSIGLPGENVSLYDH